MSTYEGGNRLRAGQVLAGILDDQPKSPRLPSVPTLSRSPRLPRSPNLPVFPVFPVFPGLASGGRPAESRTRAAANSERARETPVLRRRRPSLWERMLLALGDEFPRSEVRRQMVGESGRLTGARNQGRHAR